RPPPRTSPFPYTTLFRSPDGIGESLLPQVVHPLRELFAAPGDVTARTRTVYRCTECGGEAPKWAGRCADCGAWNTLVEEIAASPDRKSTRLNSSHVKISY